MIIRPDNREADQLRSVSFQPGIAPHAAGSVIAAFGNTRVICAATLEEKVPAWMRAQGVKGGWLTAEYSLLPYSTLDRKPRDISRGKLDGRTVEIQRLIGRSLRAVADLEKLEGMTLWIDCDVLQADGGTRTASISGAYVAAKLAVKKFIAAGKLAEDPFTDSVAAVSVGIYQETPILDLCYVEDKDAAVDANVVMTGTGRFVELQSSGEEATFSPEELAAMIALGNFLMMHRFYSAAFSAAGASAPSAPSSVAGASAAALAASSAAFFSAKALAFSSFTFFSASRRALAISFLASSSFAFRAAKPFCLLFFQAWNLVSASASPKAPFATPPNRCFFI